MLMKIGGLARALSIVLAIVAGFVALRMMNVPLVLVVLGLIAGSQCPRRELVLAAVTIVALPIVGAALEQHPDDRRTTERVCCNLQLGVAGAFATAIAIEPLSIGDGRRDGPDRQPPAARQPQRRCNRSFPTSGSAAPRGGAFFLRLGRAPPSPARWPAPVR